MTREQRSRCMAAIKGKDTTPELIVRKYLFSLGLRFRIQVGKLPGRPDIVLPKYKTAIFVDGCFWHGHEGCKYFRIPKSNTEFWQTKISRNKARDARTHSQLESMGWRVIRIWECELKTVAKRQACLENLYAEIVGRPNDERADNISIAAEPAAPYGD